MEDPTNLKLLALFCLKVDQFWFLLMLRTYAAEVVLKRVTKVAIEKYLKNIQVC